MTTRQQWKKNIEKLKKTIEKWKNTMQQPKKHIEQLKKYHGKIETTRDKSMNIMEKSMKTMDKSKNTMEKIMKPVDKLMIMRDCSYKMQQMNNFSCKNQGREPGRLQKQKSKKKQFNSAPNEKWANCSDLGVFKSGKSSQNCTRFMRAGVL
jgi:polyribonucleotide nucleotidyltransferase